ncbi:trypsin-like peptidase domain-containing protein [Candidatus Marithrix sp. Canyon 246]|uniref:trypsin-like peptidase domain-containing protein n=1 Tax=Candidatus Marithrix sp. Canyon 246 TaxID=1827136 RepID=UPI000849F822|nr:trypsin-like peptidase domain-containing protein [Candidatus Marithrix sp. Canyon 246]
MNNEILASEEDIFKQALAYTVKIKARVDKPFLGDEKGAFTAAGFLVDAKQRLVMTNAHVVARSPSHVSVAFYNGHYYKARKLYVDPVLDLALLKLPKNSIPKGIKAAQLECKNIPAVGHPVGALGHPWGIFFTGTRGVISGITDKFGGEFLQTDAPINSGNSGGPLISMKTAKVVGINTSSLNKNQDQNTNFATPMKYACRVLELLQIGKNPSPPELPILFQLDIDDSNKLIVASTHLASDLIALENGDIIEKFENETQFIHALRGNLDNFSLAITRQNKKMILSGRLNAMQLVTERKGIFVSGIVIAPWWIRDWQEVNLPPLVIHNVEAGSIGDDQKIQNWDNLVSIDRKPMKNLKQLFAYLKAAKLQDKKVYLTIKRFSDLDDRLYDYLERPLKVVDLKYFGGKKK